MLHHILVHPCKVFEFDFTLEYIHEHLSASTATRKLQKKNLPHTSQSEEAALFGGAERKNDEIFDCPIIALFRTVHSLQIPEGFINFQ